MALIKIINSRQGIANILLTLDESIYTLSPGTFHRFGNWYITFNWGEGNKVPLNINVNVPTNEDYTVKLYRKNDSDTVDNEIYSENISNVTTFNKLYIDKTPPYLQHKITYRAELIKQGNLVVKTIDLPIGLAQTGSGPVSSDSSGSSPGN